MPNLRGRTGERSGRDQKAESDEEFDLELGEEDEDEDGYRGSYQRNEPKPKTTEQGGDKCRHAKTKTWSNVVKSLKIEDKLETANTDKNENESETTDLV